jgi:hypothetical protein
VVNTMRKGHQGRLSQAARRCESAAVAQMPEGIWMPPTSFFHRRGRQGDHGAAFSTRSFAPAARLPASAWRTDRRAFMVSGFASTRRSTREFARL